MCPKVIAADTVITSPRELIAFVGDERFVAVDHAYPPLAEMLDACLCPVDVAATITAAGRTARYEEWGDYRVDDLADGQEPGVRTTTAAP